MRTMTHFDLCAFLAALACFLGPNQAMPLSFNTSDISMTGDADSVYPDSSISLIGLDRDVAGASKNASAAFEQNPAAMVYPNFEQWPDAKQLERIKQAYRESFDLARSAYHSVPGTSAYDRYLGGTDSRFNLNVFLGMFESKVSDPNKLFEKMVIWYGAPPDARDDCKDKPSMLGYLLQKPDFPDEYVHLIICTRTMQLPLISEMSCEKLSDHVDKSFDTLAATLLHEYVHWSALMKKALETKNPPQRKIHDFEAPPGSDPENGYGPYNAMRIKEKHDPTDNADNYAWFALEAFWTRKCVPMEQYRPPRKGEPSCDIGDKEDLAEDCHAG